MDHLHTPISTNGPRHANDAVRRTILGISLLIVPVLQAQTTWPDDASPDDFLYRERIRSYGLGEWLDIDDAEQSMDEVAKLLRRRETLLKDATNTALSAEIRRSRLDEAIALLDVLLDAHRDHVNAVSWYILAAEDRIYRSDPRALRRLLLYEIPTPEHGEALRLSTEALEHLAAAREEIQRRWEHVGTLSEGELSWLKETGVIGRLERQDRQVNDLLVWAALYRALATGADETTRRATLFQDVLGRLEPVLDTLVGSNSPTEHAQALLAATVSARHLDRHDEAIRHARAFIDVYRAMSDSEARQRVRWTLLPAALERVRCERDAGHREDALSMLASMKESAADTLAEDIEMAWALALLEHGLLSDVESTTDTSIDFTTPLALQPLEATAGLSPGHLDFMYRLLSVALRDHPLEVVPTPFARLLLAGAAQAYLMIRKEDAGATIRTRVADTLKLLEDDVFAATPSQPSYEGERLFLRGRGLYLLGSNDEAILMLCRMAEVAPDHTRTPFALEQAAILAHQRLADSNDEDIDVARQQFIRTVQLLRELAVRRPEAEISSQMRFLMALALEQSDRMAEAAAAYAEIAPENDYAVVAGQRRVHCLLRLLDQARARTPEDTAGQQALAREALQAAREAHRVAHERVVARPLEEKPLCEAAGSILLYAHVANLPETRLPNDVLAILVDFDTRFAPCSEARREAMSERIDAWVELERWEDARRALQEKVQQADLRAGPAMAQLLERMRDAIRDEMGSGTPEAVRSTALQAAALADDLLAWHERQPEAMSDSDTETVRVWRAWALLRAEEFERALQAFEAYAPAPATDAAEVSALQLEVRLGRAECLQHLDQIEEAVKEFTAIWRRLPEHSDYWWRAYANSLEAHLALGSDPQEIVQSIRQQRHLEPDLGGAIWKRKLESIEERARARSNSGTSTASAPSESP